MSGIAFTRNQNIGKTQVKSNNVHPKVGEFSAFDWDDLSVAR